MSNPNPDTRKVIAIAGAGDLGRYVCEELLKSPIFTPIILTRGTANKWFGAYPDLPVHITDYTPASLLSILNTTSATTLISFINNSDPHTYISTHTAILTACANSRTCKRFIPSEWIGDVEKFPLQPPFYARTREPFRKLLRDQRDVEWTLVNVGWLADYFLPEGKSYMTPAKGTWPVDVDGWRACVRGSGDEGQSWTAARDVGRAVVELCKAEKWEPITYIAAEFSTFNNAIRVIESFYGRPLPRTQKPLSEIRDSITRYTAQGDTEALEGAEIEEMMVMGCLACPREKTERQRREFFSGVEFRDLKALLEMSEGEGGV